MIILAYLANQGRGEALEMGRLFTHIVYVKIHRPAVRKHSCRTPASLYSNNPHFRVSSSTLPN